jgi:alkylation response protein AidB-like acyl-CoA dehydrogenase
VNIDVAAGSLKSRRARRRPHGDRSRRENAWSATLEALQSIEARANSAALDVAIAKAKASETARAATAERLQMHGGIEMTDEFDIGLFLKRARVDSVLFGDAAFHADRVATMLGY